MVRILFLLTLAVVALIIPRPAFAQDHEDDHSHGVARHLDHDHGDGFPEFVDVFFAHHAYLEKKLHLRVDATVENEVNEFEESAELAWQFNRWLGAEIEVPFVQIDPDDGDGAGGLGDIEVAPIVALYQNPESLTILSVRSGFGLPTGDADEGLGADGWTWEPGVLLWQGIGAEKRGAIQAELTYERFFPDEAEEEDEEELVFNLAFSHWLENNLIPIAELNVVSPIGEEEEEDLPVPQPGLALASGDGGSEDTVVSTTLGFRYAFANGQQWGGGVQFPLSSTESYDYRVVVGGIIHF